MSEANAEKQTTIVLYPCLIAKRGKGVKGVYEPFESFGIPVHDEKDKDKKGPVSEWLYGPVVKGQTLQSLYDRAEQISGLNNQQLLEGAVMGWDLMRRSESKKNASEVNALIELLLQEDLAEDEDKAERTALGLFKMQSDARNNCNDVPTMEYLLTGRRKFVALQKEKGLWKSKLVKKDSEKAEEKSAEVSK